jgi:hypothetical protein
MPVRVWGCAEDVSVIYHSQRRHARRCMHTCRNCLNNLPFPTEACAEVYPYPPKLFRKFTMINRGMLVRVWGCAEGVSVIYSSQRRHARRCMHTSRNCFDNLPFPTEACVEVYHDQPRHASKGMGMCRRCFGNLQFPMEACQEVYTYLPKLFR